MKEKFLAIPSPLQKQILLRLGGSGAGLIMLVLVLTYGGGWQFLIPCIALIAICLSTAVSLYDQCIQKKYVIVDGVCAEIDRVTFSRRIKALYLRNDQYSVKLVGIRKIKNLVIGDHIRVYIADTAAVYELDGNQVICNYLAIEKGNKSATRENARID